MRYYFKAQARSLCGSHTSTVAVLGKQAGAAAKRSFSKQPRSIQLDHSVAAFQLQTVPQQRLTVAAAGRAVRCRCSSTPPNAEPVTPLVVVEGVSYVIRLADWWYQCCSLQTSHTDAMQPFKA